MAKRFTDSDKWKKPWFRKLTPLQKCFWFYLLDNCDQAGFWPVDFDLAEFFIGAPLDQTEMRDVFKKQYEELADGRKWFIRDFIGFQYGELKESNRLHTFVSKIIEKQGVLTPLICPPQGAKDKVKDKDKDKGVVRGKFVKPTLEQLTDYFTDPETGGLDAVGAKALAQKYLAHYESVGWVVGKACKPMKNWRGAASTFIQNRREWAKDSSDCPNPMNFNKKQIANMEALSDFVKRKGTARPEDLRPGDGNSILRLPGH